jgi:hypothetical protein
MNNETRQFIEHALRDNIEAELVEPVQEPMYLVFYSDANTPDVWMEVDKKRFDETKEDHRLAVYTSPQAREPVSRKRA